LTAIAKAFANVMPALSTEVDMLRVVAMFCGVGLVISLPFVSYGLDLSAGFF
jgi:hypothetical protein